MPRALVSFVLNGIFPQMSGRSDWSRIDAMKLKISVSKICLVGKAGFYLE